MAGARSTSVKRIMREMKELAEATDQYYAAPLEDNMFEWHFTIRGPDGSDFEGGIYHGRIILPPEYPMKPPSIILLTPNGRFEVGKKICLSISAYHPETWQPSWSIRTALLALIGFMPTEGKGAVGSLDYTPVERKELAKRSVAWRCPTCGSENRTHLKMDHKAPEQTEAERDAISQLTFKGEEKPKEETTAQTQSSSASAQEEGAQASSSPPATVSGTAPEAPEPVLVPASPPRSVAQPTNVGSATASASPARVSDPVPSPRSSTALKPPNPPSNHLASLAVIIVLLLFVGFLLHRKLSRLDGGPEL